MNIDLKIILPIITLLIGTFSGAFLNYMFIRHKEKSQKKRDLKNKKILIIADLDSQKHIINRMRQYLYQLKIDFENYLKNETNIEDDSEIFTDDFHDLQINVFMSVTKADLYQIFGRDLFILVNIYNSINFLRGVPPEFIYKKYVENVKNESINFYGKYDTNFNREAKMKNSKLVLRQVKDNLREIKGILVNMEIIINNHAKSIPDEKRPL